MGGTISAIAKLCAHLNGDRARAVHDEFINDGVRVKAGDKALHLVIDQNHDVVNRAAANGDALAVALQHTRNDAAIAPRGGAHYVQPYADGEQLPWAKEQNGTRAIQMCSNIQTMAMCRKKKINVPKIQNFFNQAPIGFSCSTKQFKTDNAIPQSTSLAEVMDVDQLTLRRWGQEEFIDEVNNGKLSKAQIERKMLSLRDELAGIAKRFKKDGFRKLPDGQYFCPAAIGIQASAAAMTARQLRLKLKEEAKSDVRKLDDGTRKTAESHFSATLSIQSWRFQGDAP